MQQKTKMAHWIIDDHGFGGMFYRCSKCGNNYSNNHYRYLYSQGNNYILRGYTSRSPAYIYCSAELSQVIIHNYNVGRINGQRSSVRSHRYTYVCRCYDRRVIKPVTAIRNLSLFINCSFFKIKHYLIISNLLQKHIYC